MIYGPSFLIATRRVEEDDADSLHIHIMEYVMIVIIAVVLVRNYLQVTRMQDENILLQNRLWELEIKQTQILTSLEELRNAAAASTAQSATPSAAATGSPQAPSAPVAPRVPPPLPASTIDQWLIAQPAQHSHPKAESPSPTSGDAPPLRPLPPLVWKSTHEEEGEPKAASLIPSLNWEQFMGVKLFAWVGGLALFLAVGFFLKYSFEHNLVPASVRVAMGMITGIGLLVGGFYLDRKRYAVTAQTLAACGILILYASIYAMYGFYHFIEPTAAFALMALTTAVAFAVSVNMNAMAVAILALVGGFLTPPLLSTGVDRPVALFSYVAFLNLGLFTVSFHKRWNVLPFLGAIGTLLMQGGWVVKFYMDAPGEKFSTSLLIFISFSVLFLLASFWGVRRQQVNGWLTASVVALSHAGLLFAFYLLTVHEVGHRVAPLFAFVLGLDLCLLLVVVLSDKLGPLQFSAGVVVFTWAAFWTAFHLTPALMNWGLGLILVFALLHAVFPMVLSRWKPQSVQAWWGHAFPSLALFLVMIPVFKLNQGGFSHMIIWPVILVIDLLAVGLAILTSTLIAVVAVLLLTLVTIGLWMTRLPAPADQLNSILIVLGGFSILFFLVGSVVGPALLQKWFNRIEEDSPQLDGSGGVTAGVQARTQISALSVILPFILLIMVVLHIPVPNPTPVFGLAMILVLLLLGLVKFAKAELLAIMGLGSVLLLEHVWFIDRFRADMPNPALIWFVVFYATFLIFPFVFRNQWTSSWTWAAAALSGPGHFYLVYQVIDQSYPNSLMGLVPAVFAIPSMAGLWLLVKNQKTPASQASLAWFGGVALFFITAIFPIQFDRQWITVAWALEGAALLWLFHRIPHPGLRLTGVGLLILVFIRLGLNPAILDYHPRGTPILNWYLYAYGVASACCLVGAHFLKAPRDKIGELSAPPLLYTLGVLLAFLLLNIEIADYFTPEGQTRLVFSFSGNLARDMSYSVGWALFAILLLIIGIWKKVPACRYASLALLAATLLKLFFHDLSNLNQLYRIGAFGAVAVIAILASFLYQRYLAGVGSQKGTTTNEH